MSEARGGGVGADWVCRARCGAVVRILEACGNGRVLLHLVPVPRLLSLRHSLCVPLLHPGDSFRSMILRLRCFRERATRRAAARKTSSGDEGRRPSEMYMGCLRCFSVLATTPTASLSPSSVNTSHTPSTPSPSLSTPLHTPQSHLARSGARSDLPQKQMGA